MGFLKFFYRVAFDQPKPHWNCVSLCFSNLKHVPAFTRRSNALHGWMPLPPPLRQETPKTRCSSILSLMRVTMRQCPSCWHIRLFFTNTWGTMPVTHICRKGWCFEPYDVWDLRQGLSSICKFLSGVCTLWQCPDYDVCIHLQGKGSGV